ncbi:MAG TPA: hypothetical protein VGA50_15035 [Kiloniellales bacterium]
MKVARQLSARDRLGAHMRDELGVDPEFLARPMQAAWVSAASFSRPSRWFRFCRPSRRASLLTHPRDRRADVKPVV